MSSLDALRQQLGVSPIISKTENLNMSTLESRASSIALSVPCTYVIVECLIIYGLGQKTLTKNINFSNNTPYAGDVRDYGTILADSEGAKFYGALNSEGSRVWVSIIGTGSYSYNISFSILGYV